jgi:hypothetical protein
MPSLAYYLEQAFPTSFCSTESLSAKIFPMALTLSCFMPACSLATAPRPVPSRTALLIAPTPNIIPMMFRIAELGSCTVS